MENSALTHAAPRPQLPAGLGYSPAQVALTFFLAALACAAPLAILFFREKMLQEGSLVTFVIAPATSAAFFGWLFFYRSYTPRKPYVVGIVSSIHGVATVLGSFLGMAAAFVWVDPLGEFAHKYGLYDHLELVAACFLIGTLLGGLFALPAGALTGWLLYKRSPWRRNLKA